MRIISVSKICDWRPMPDPLRALEYTTLWRSADILLDSTKLECRVQCITTSSSNPQVPACQTWHALCQSSGRTSICPHVHAARGHLSVLEVAVGALRPSKPTWQVGDSMLSKPSTAAESQNLLGNWAPDAKLRRALDKANWQGMTPLMMAAAAG